MKKLRKSNKIKKLEWNDSLIDVYPHHAFITAILGESDYNMPLLFNHYIQIVYDKEIVRSDFDIALHIQDFVRLLPMMYSHSVSRSLVKSKWKSFTEFLIDMIDDGYYVHCLVDTYHIKAYKDTYQNSHFWHNITIYGYNQKEKEFNVADSFYNGKFEKKMASFNEIDKSFIDTYKEDWLDGIILLKLKEEPYAGVFYAPELIQKEIDDYLNGEVTDYITMREKYRRNKEQFVYYILLKHFILKAICKMKRKFIINLL